MRHRLRVVGIDFAHPHVMTLLRQVLGNPHAELVGIADANLEILQAAQRSFGLAEENLFTDYRRLLEERRPDIAIVCAANVNKAEYVEAIAARKVHLLVEKPMAARLHDADRMMAAADENGVRMMINWPMAWYPQIVTAHRLVSEGAIGELLQVHYRNGNRGPLYHKCAPADPQPSRDQVERYWMWRRDSGGGALLDYCCYGATLATWFHGKSPGRVTAMAAHVRGFEVEDNVVIVAQYDKGLSILEATWTALTNPWLQQPEPPHGFVFLGEHGSLTAYDGPGPMKLCTPEHPEGKWLEPDPLPEGRRNGVEYFVDCVRLDRPVEAPLSPAIGRAGQKILEAAILSIEQGRTISLPLLGAA